MTLAVQQDTIVQNVTLDLIEISDRSPEAIEQRLAWAYRSAQAFAKLRRENARLRAALIAQRDLWHLAKATAAARATFISTNDPIGRIDEALGDVAV